jgi:hypothetical protein
MGNINCNCLKIENNSWGGNVIKANDIIFETSIIKNTEELQMSQIDIIARSKNLKSKISQLHYI